MFIEKGGFETVFLHIFSFSFYKKDNTYIIRKRNLGEFTTFFEKL